MNGYAQVSQPIKPQRRVDQSRAANPERFRKAAEYLATINLSKAPRWEYELKTLPRVKGRGTKVIITEYDLPRADDRAARRDRGRRRRSGTRISASSSSASSIPKTGKHTEYRDEGVQAGLPDRQPRPQRRQGRQPLARHDVSGRASPSSIRKTEQFQILPAAAGARQRQLAAQHGDANRIARRRQALGQRRRHLDPAPPRSRDRQVRGVRSAQGMLPGGKSGHSIYDVRADSQNNAYRDGLPAELPRSGSTPRPCKFTVYQTRHAVLAQPRAAASTTRTASGSPQYRGNKITMFDTKTEKIHGIRAADQAHASL